MWKVLNLLVFCYMNRLSMNILHAGDKLLVQRVVQCLQCRYCWSQGFWAGCIIFEKTSSMISSLFMFHLSSISPHFIVCVSSHFLQSTLHCSCFILISFSPQSTSFISPTTVHLIHIYLIWLQSQYMVIQPYCQFHFPANHVSGN